MSFGDAFVKIGYEVTISFNVTVKHASRFNEKVQLNLPKLNRSQELFGLSLAFEKAF